MQRQIRLIHVLLLAGEIRVMDDRIKRYLELKDDGTAIALFERLAEDLHRLTDPNDRHPHDLASNVCVILNDVGLSWPPASAGERSRPGLDRRQT